MRLGPSYRTAEAILWPPMMAATRREWHGGEHLGQHGQGIIVAPNHISWFDPIAIAHFLHDHGRPPRFLAKHAVFEVPVVGGLIRGCEQIPVTRDADPSKALAAAEQALAAGECVVVYPEGTITRDPDLWPMSGRTGAIRLALETGAPLIPVAQWGAHEVMPPYSKAFKILPPKRMRVTAGPPVPLDDLRGQPITRELLAEGTDRLMDAITGLLEQIRGEHAPEHRLDWAAERTRLAAERNEEER
ncbi:MAG: 1-acyl-sn-glycerol-3-phosphate acyltransferase [Candidatus Nanopelagicales bacterium]|jgi:1-acyl-sn-glycerol-3-phosphate acyltransferase|nr:1-acyl-sn-glycerol-3-phosphate acyltransferase [Candidatus Nanopelagicales bacterium]